MLPETQVQKTISDIFIGRQPIYDRSLHVIGYELLYRHANIDQARFVSADYATSQVVLNAFAEMGLDKLVSGKKAFLNLTRNFFLEKYPLPFLPEQLILEVTETTGIDDELIEAILAFKARGFQIALDDVVLAANVAPLLQIADIVKVDLVSVERSRLGELVAAMKKHNLILLAEKVETPADFNYCKELGFNYFQGYFLCRPDVVQGKKIPTSRLVILELMHQIQDENVDFNTLESLLAQDVALSYKLIRLVNSGFYSTAVKISSIRQAIGIIGLEQLRGWLILFLMSKTGDKSREATIISMIRARMCELLARVARLPNPATYFLVGLFSMLDVLMEVPMDQVLDSLHLSDEVVGALVSHQGPMGEALKCAVAYEVGDWDNVQFKNLPVSDLRDVYLDSLQWVSNAVSALEI